MNKFIFTIFSTLVFISCHHENKNKLNFNQEVYTPLFSENFYIKSDEKSRNTLI